MTKLGILNIPTLEVCIGEQFFGFLGKDGSLGRLEILNATGSLASIL